MDTFDLKILQELQKDGRQSFRNIARKLGVAESTIRKRVRSLRNKGVIRISAVPNPYKLGYNFISIVGMQIKMSDLHTAGEILAKEPNIYYLSFVTGQYDLLAIVISRTPQELSNFIQEHISPIPGVIRTETFVNMEILKGPWTTPMDVIELLNSTKSDTKNHV